MTDLLKDTLTRQAESAEPPTLDLDSVISAGNRRSRRRTVTTAVGTAFVALAVLATGLTAVHALGNDNTPAPAARPTTPSVEHRPTYAVGNVIHYGTETIQADAKVTAIVQTDNGLVYATGEFKHPGQVTLLDRTGKHVLSGKTQYPSLTSDGHSIISWFEEGHVGEPNGGYVVYDVAEHRQVRRLPIDAETMNGAGDPDRGSIYVSVAQLLYRLDLRTGNRTTIGDMSNKSLLAISGDIQLYSEHRGDNSVIFVADLPNAGRRRVELGQTRGDQGWGGSFAPDGKRAVIWAGWESAIGRLQVRTTPDGKNVPIGARTYQLQRFAGWLDNDRFAMVAATGSKAPADLLTCSTADGSCTVVRRNIAAGLQGHGVVLPTR